MIKYYIATRLSRHKEHNIVRDALNEMNHKITYDWTIHGSQKHVSLGRLEEVGEAQVEAIREADVVIVLLPGGAGTHTEFGIALGLNKKIIIHSESSEFFQLGDKACAFYFCKNLHQVQSDIEEFASKLPLLLQPEHVS